MLTWELYRFRPEQAEGSLYGSIEVVGRAKFVPSERLSDGVLGYYDAYSETFYTPTGTPPTVIE